MIDDDGMGPTGSSIAEEKPKKLTGDDVFGYVM